jgi:uncharacterized protein YllA (UPF0747 family)
MEETVYIMTVLDRLGRLAETEHTYAAMYVYLFTWKQICRYADMQICRYM